MRAANVRTAGTVYIVGTVGEEGPGNLRGVRALFAGELKGKIDYFISVDGTGLGAVSGAVGSNRYRVSYKGPGGHSYGAFGMPNPIHAMGRAIAKLSEFTVPDAPRTTFSASIVSGGTSVNSIPYEGIVEVDMRSESAASLATLDAKFQIAIRDALREEIAHWPRQQGAADHGHRHHRHPPCRLAAGQCAHRPDCSRSGQGTRLSGHTARVAAPTPMCRSASASQPSHSMPADAVRRAHSLTESYDDGPNGYPRTAVRGAGLATLALLR